MPRDDHAASAYLVRKLGRKPALGARAPALRRGLLTDPDADDCRVIRRPIRSSAGADLTPTTRGRGESSRSRSWRGSTRAAPASRASCCRNRQSAMAPLSRRISGRPCSASSRTAASPSTTIAPRPAARVAVGRKNWLFAGNIEGARRAALLYSLVQSCKLATSALRLPQRRPDSRRHASAWLRIHQLTPKGWGATFGPHAAV